ncbi:hypothetical protein EJ05DRAFT_274973 [Pseudovirgaria hyperparasitica]|uniref:Uncharacterized protein n=1 Tax=Pseudovirgaria hyperparasitica TaxID=470096 RepID=A0A6A6WE84_9PEZI|nr:uncharacterized protein EJ05DRAFT_274973 [Pseudovirgaria hyperparasitica]KAF2760186.1 hypothetical protein EJ05DRAFT_274973 [Pseudovirgaria hyperparasitica]
MRWSLAECIVHVCPFIGMHCSCLSVCRYALFMYIVHADCPLSILDCPLTIPDFTFSILHMGYASSIVHMHMHIAVPSPIPRSLALLSLIADANKVPPTPKMDEWLNECKERVKRRIRRGARRRKSPDAPTARARKNRIKRFR